MTFNEAYEQALIALGYVNDDGVSAYNTLNQKKNAVLLRVYNDLAHLCKKETKTTIDLHGDIDLPQIVVDDCFVFGVAMWMAQSENDGDNQGLFSALYNQKRALCTTIRLQKDSLGGEV